MPNAIKTVGLLSPGDMGHSIGGVLRDNGITVLTCLAGRSERTRALAAKSGFEDTSCLEEMIERADAILSVLVPAEAPGLAEQVAAATGSVRVTDLGVGGFVLGKLGGAAGAGWANSAEGKVIAAAFLDAHNQLVTQVRELQAKDLPPPVATKKKG